MSTKHSTTDATGPNSSEQQHDLYLMGKQELYANAGFILGFLDDKKGGILDLYEPEAFINEVLANPVMNLWIALDRGKIEGLLPVAFDDDPVGRRLHIVAINCVDFLKYRSTIWKVEKWAFECGCSEIQWDGSRAMRKLWGDDSYKEHSIRYRKSLVKQWGH